ncbi:hypothetical protein [Pedobacter aquatilis]|uniref:hypothetical protein n=1 Tax=Pedobacter aquatilis TaxID=351343 RepID=UPI00292D7317|nr:hypothetical protein [Pedobacter aquatilis]
MGQNSNVSKHNVPHHDMVSSSKMLVLDYLFGSGDELEAYQLVRFATDEPWLVLQDGILLATMAKHEGKWIEIGVRSLEEAKATAITKFIDQQHFNFLPGKIKTHWPDQIQEVIMQTDSLYLVITKEGIDFLHFKRLFSQFIGQLVEDEWAVEFKVYRADFNEEFLVRIF